jgi:hypothetical protein
MIGLQNRSRSRGLKVHGIIERECRGKGNTAEQMSNLISSVRTQV